MANRARRTTSVDAMSFRRLPESVQAAARELAAAYAVDLDRCVRIVFEEIVVTDDD